ncbi:P-II family nitrogen regulator [Bacillus sonorensis]|uniref:Nitrogen regulatory protein P-II n=2 Tax=Bacillus sonorensis TaxID=119858 RepID=M5P204_9BACI|nr:MULTISPECIES: P-II family nitrogen regulator [Bacillus]TWK80658.1 Nitrogen regulatory PII-like protein [Bacillus paralicheniformis]ASB87055.1 Nitrogen regulatory PII-like protein [Bacillus sonorensis]EME73458.1 nitrogen regulatory protein P-II [Bacillus sonorensis L12]MBG9914436.1 nitrogen regulatory PII [Bacillus sonorensis]MCF7616307.1 P-II family nitrogen regulator [Bacillus sonorensis]
MSGQMYKVEIVTRPTNFEKLKTELAKIGVTSITFYNVHGCGLQKGHTELYRGVKRESNVYERLKVEIVVSKVPVEKVAETAQKVLKTGEPGDGKIFIYEIQNTINIRTGEEGPDAL